MGPGPQPHFQIYFLSGSDVGVADVRVTLPDQCLFDFDLHKVTWGACRFKLSRSRVGPETLHLQLPTSPPLALQPYPKPCLKLGSMSGAWEHVYSL